MSNRLVALAFLLVSPAALAGPFGLPIGGVQLPEDNKDTCIKQIDEYLGMYCTDKYFEFVANEGRAGEMIAQQGENMSITCQNVKSLKDKLAEVKTCTDKLRAISAEAVKAEQERIPALKARIPEIQANPEYVDIHGRYKTADRAYDRAAADMDHTKKIGQVPTQDQMNLVTSTAKTREEAMVEMKAWFEKNGINYRDASKVGLF